ncbi:MAG: hypothetical protein H7Y04_05875 [Verrucomicrobia bacterium]|nr:hypothetical protein [Cytophagales bacterium]
MPKTKEMSLCKYYITGKSALYFTNCLLFCLLLSSCQTLNQVPNVEEGIYHLSKKEAKKHFLKTEKLKVFVQDIEDSLLLIPVNNPWQRKTLYFDKNPVFRLQKNTFDVDILTLPFKIRPSQQGFPIQLNANFSAAVYLGRRTDFYTIRYKKNFINELERQNKDIGIGFGGFLGLGSVTMNGSVTSNQIGYEYDGFVIDAGAAGIYDAKRFNIGLAIGIDYLFDNNRNFWLYQNKPWVGILFGLNLN